MSDQIIKQPDGLLAVWSTVVDDWTITDASPDELLDHYAEVAAAEARRQVQRRLDLVLAGERAYHQFTMTFDEAQERRLELHGSAPWPIPSAIDSEAVIVGTRGDRFHASCLDCEWESEGFATAAEAERAAEPHRREPHEDEA